MEESCTLLDSYMCSGFESPENKKQVHIYKCPYIFICIYTLQLFSSYNSSPWQLQNQNSARNVSCYWKNFSWVSNKLLIDSLCDLHMQICIFWNIKNHVDMNNLDLTVFGRENEYLSWLHYSIKKHVPSGIKNLDVNCHVHVHHLCSILMLNIYILVEIAEVAISFSSH